MNRLKKACEDAMRAVIRLGIAMKRFNKKERLPRKLKKQVKKEATRRVFELQFEVYK